MSPIRSSRRRIRVALLVLVPLTLAATAAWMLGGRTPASPPAATRTEAAPWTRLPLHGLLSRPSDASRRAHEAEQRLVAACMKAHGFDYTPAPAASGSDTSPALFGFEPLDAADAAGASEPQPSEQARSQAFDRALYGDPDRRISARNKVLRVTRPATGCLAEAQTRLLGEGGRVRDLTLRLQLDQGERDALSALEKDPAFRALNARWRSCVARYGVTAEDPRQLAAGLPRGTNPTVDPSARADLECKERTGYLERAYGRLAALQRRWMEANPKPVADWKALRLHEDGEARRTLMHGTP